MLEDQRRPRRCGHVTGKLLLPVPEYVEKLRAALRSRSNLVILARTDATSQDEALERARAYAEAGADAVMVEAVRDLASLRQLAQTIRVPILVNQLLGGQSPNWSQRELAEAGASMVAYSTPCLFAAQQGIKNYLAALARDDGRLTEHGSASLEDCQSLLKRDRASSGDLSLRS